MIVGFEEALATFQKIDCYNKSFYYHPLFIEVTSRESKDLKPVYFVKEEKGQFFYHTALIGEIGFEGYRDLQTPYGYGGPLIRGDAAFKEKAVEEYITWCYENKILVEFVRFHPLVKNEQDYYGDLINNRETVAIDLKVEDIFRSFSTRVKTAIRLADKKSVQVIVSKEAKYIAAFYEIYTNLMKEKQTTNEYFFSKNYIKDLLDHKEIYLFNAVTEEGEMLGASIFLLCDKIADYHLSATTEIGRTLNVSHLLLYKFAQFAKERGVELFYLGGGTNSDPANSLLFFKKGFSKETYPFFIGYTIFNQSKYDEYKQTYLNYADKRYERILFYR